MILFLNFINDLDEGLRKTGSNSSQLLGERRMLKDIDEKGRAREMRDIEYRDRFDSKWSEFTAEEQQAMDSEITRLLDALLADPDPKWGPIMNTSIEGGKVNPVTGVPGDWSGTPWHPIWLRHDQSNEQAALFFGTLWKLRIIQRPEGWIGIRASGNRPTFPNRGISLAGKTYFPEMTSYLPKQQKGKTGT